MLGAGAFISRAKNRRDVVRGYQMIESAMIDYSQYQILAYDEPAAVLFDQFRKQSVRIGTMDLRIAAIAVSHGYTLLTRNTVDFQKVPGLQHEDWTA